MSSFAWVRLVLAVTVQAAAFDSGEALPEQRKAADAFLKAMMQGNWKAASKDFDTTMQTVLPPDKLEQTWNAITSKVGLVKQQVGVRTEVGTKYDFVFLTCKFDKETLDVRVVFDKDKRLAGFALLPLKPTEFAAPPYAKRDAFREEEVVVGKDGEWPLPGTLSIPKGNGPFPAVVLVHGSGSHDRDETIGPNKPLRDLAWGLASQGVAVLRYTKRTKADPAKFVKLGNFTLQEETIDDARAAVALLQSRKDIDPKRVFVLGHSLGAMAAPRIAEQSPGVAGAIVLAGNSRPLEDLIVEQFGYLFSLGGEISASDQKMLEKIKKQAVAVKSKELDNNTPKDNLPLGLNAAYWLYLRNYNQVATAAKLAVPLLILQGERDYQVTMDDFAGWKKGLAGRKNVRVKSYPALNHLFMQGSGKSKPGEYDKAGHVAKEVVDDIAAWIKSQ